MLAILKSFFESLTAALRTFEANINQQATSQLLKDKRRLKEAADITENILEITDKYTSYFNHRDLNDYVKLKRKFLRKN